MGVQQGRPAQGSAAYLNDIATELAPGNRCTVGASSSSSSSGSSSGGGWECGAALRHAAARAVAQAAETMRRAGGGKLVFEGQAWNANTVDLIRWGVRGRGLHALPIGSTSHGG